MEQVVSKFMIEGEIIKIQPLTQGLINRTYEVITTTNHYLLQEINTNIFKDIEGLMDNIIKVTNFLKAKGEKTLNVIYTKDNKSHEKQYRMYDYIENTFAYDAMKDASLFYKTGEAFGHFHSLLKDFDEKLIDTIPQFHDTPHRLKQFEEAINNNIASRKDEVAKEIDYLLSCKKIAYLLDDEDLLTVSHNDTKLGNILFDKTTLDVVCVIDLDTMMMGYMAHDFGDALRSGANTVSEDEGDLSLIDFDITQFKAFTDGFIKQVGVISDKEKQSLVYGIYVLIYEQAIRFLSDYLNGDTYYTIQYEKHNLVRARNQIQLLKKAISKYDEIQTYIMGGLM